MKTFTITILFVVFQLASLAQFNKGAKVLINYQDQWYAGKILEAKENKTYLVSYDDYDASWNEVVTLDRLKPNETTAAAQKNTASGSTASTNPAVVSGEKKATEMCNCLKTMMKTQKQENKSRCLNLQEEHVAALGKGSEQYMIYKKMVNDCEKEITQSKTNTVNKAGKEPVTYEEKAKAVCDCFKEARTDRGKTMECYKKQDDYSKTVGAKKTDFIQETNMCQ